MENNKKFNASEIVGVVASLVYSLYYLRVIYLPLWQNFISYSSRSYTESAVWDLVLIFLPNIPLALFFTFAPIRPKYKIILSVWLIVVCLMLIYINNFRGITPVIYMTPFLLPISFGLFKYFKQE